jgi:hypothetical protein
MRTLIAAIFFTVVVTHQNDRGSKTKKPKLKSRHSERSEESLYLPLSLPWDQAGATNRPK